MRARRVCNKLLMVDAPGCDGGGVGGVWVAEVELELNADQSSAVRTLLRDL